MSAVEIGLAAEASSQQAFRELSPFGVDGRERINHAGRALLTHGVLSSTRSFNAGIRVPGEERFVLGGFTAEGPFAPAAIVGFDGTYYEGKFKKNHLELLDVYATIFRERPDVQAAIHTHSPYLEGFCFAHRELPVIFGDDLARITRDPIPLVPWGPRYSADTIHNAVRKSPTAPAVLIANHGLFAWGPSIEATVDLIIALEDTAHVATKAQLLLGGTPLPVGLPQ
jgi:L-ribulose-5-phosphate 4-epimerase